MSAPDHQLEPESATGRTIRASSQKESGPAGIVIQDRPAADVGPAGPLVELVGVTKNFRGVLAVDDVSLAVKRGEFLSLLGPSGCGKTTTLRIVGGFERPTSGQILIDGRDVAGVPPHRRPVNTVFQSYALFWNMTVFDNVAFGLRERRVPGKEVTRRVSRMLDLVQLTGLDHRRTWELSGGQQQRVALARAIVNEPSILLLDEPLGALDLKLRRTMQTELTELQQNVGISFLYVTHDQEEAFSMSDRVAVMGDGRLVQVGTPEELYDRPASRYVADFVGAANILEGTIVSRAGHSVEVRLSADAVVRATLAIEHSAAVGSSVYVMIRPERVDIQPVTGADVAAAGPNSAFALSGLLRSHTFVGAHRKLVFALDTGQELTTVVANRGEQAFPLEPGSRVELTWRPEDAWVTSS